MTSYIPAAPKLKDIAAADVINYKGNSTTVSSVTSVTDNGGGRTTVVVVLAAAGSPSVTLQTKDTVLSSYHITQAGVTVATWSQSVAP